MAPEPEDRHASADQMANEIESFLARPRRIALQAAALLLAAMAVVIGSWWSRQAIRTDPSARGDLAADARPGEEKSAPAVEAPPSSLPLRIESLEVMLHRRAPGRPRGTGRRQHLRGPARPGCPGPGPLQRPGLLLPDRMNPDGSTQLCLPDEPAAAPPALTAIDFPPDPGSGFGLTDGPGTQVFVLVASTRPLPPFREWSRAVGDLPWRPAETEIVWRYDGRRFESDTDRGEVRPLADLPPSLAATCRTLRGGPGVEAIRALAFPVKPTNGSKD